MTVAQLIFWISLAIVFYSYLGYGMLIWLLLKLRSVFTKVAPTEYDPAFLPPVTLVIATFNEEVIIEEKIKNSLALDYPAGRLKIVFVADGSNDHTVELIKGFPEVELYFEPQRAGKVAAINRVMPYISTEFVIFSDANTLLNTACIKEIIKHYINENIGAVAGEKKIIDQSEDQNAAGAGEGLYWKYESILKRLDARFYTVVGAAGELFSIRTKLFEPVGNNVLLDDFIISMKICRKGYRVMYEPGAYASEAPSFSMKDEQKRKIRISAGGFQSVFMLKDLLNIFKYGKLSFQYISHRVLRWILCPALLPLIFITNIYLACSPASPLYFYILLMQVAFYVIAAAGWLFALRDIKIKAFYIPYYFVFMNVALCIGFSRFINNRQTVLWEKAKRKL